MEASDQDDSMFIENEQQVMEENNSNSNDDPTPTTDDNVNNGNSNADESTNQSTFNEPRETFTFLSHHQFNDEFDLDYNFDDDSRDPPDQDDYQGSFEPMMMMDDRENHSIWTGGHEMMYGDPDEDGEINENEGAAHSDEDVIESESESELADIAPDEIDSMLEEGIKDSDKPGTKADAIKKNLIKRKASLLSTQKHEERKKIVLKKRGQDYFDILPAGWLEVTHFSGMPVYLHKQTRVCTLAKPYYLGQGSARKHDIPISAIPCLQYRQELEKERQLAEAAANVTPESGSAPSNGAVENQTEQPDQSSLANASGQPSSAQVPTAPGPFISPKSFCPVRKGPGFKGKRGMARVESVKRHTREQSLSYYKVREYCQRLFEFQEITIRKFKTWADRRKHNQLRRLKQRPTLPEGTKLITCPVATSKDATSEAAKTAQREFIMNPTDKSPVCILHEFVQHTQKVQPKYIFKEIENAITPFSATVVIKDEEWGDKKWGVGYGSSKKQAKEEAAKATLEILIPGYHNMVESEKKRPGPGANNDLSFFDDIKIEDPRVSELCAKAGQSSPYQILGECLRRNSGMGNTEIKTDTAVLKNQRIKFTMKVGDKHEVNVICKNKRDGKQRAAQALLQKLHPQLTNWGSLLRLYGRGSCLTPKEKKEEEQKITELQSTACPNKPNVAILNKLREEMLKLRERQPVHTFIPDIQPLPSGGGQLKLVDL